MEEALALARREPQRFVVFYQDEVSFYRQPTQSWLWHSLGRRQPRLSYSHHANTLMRVVGYFQPLTGQLDVWDYGKVTVPHFAQTLRQMARKYAQYEKIMVILDNWSVHFHPQVQEVLAQEPRLELIPLPTYAAWLNPIEKVWRWCKQGLVHAHPWANDFRLFRRKVLDYLAQLQNGSTEILRYAGCYVK